LLQEIQCIAYGPDDVAFLFPLSHYPHLHIEISGNIQKIFYPFQDDILGIMRKREIIRVNLRFGEIYLFSVS
jgi:hypothetical protein